jgi:hypothetical protein
VTERSSEENISIWVSSQRIDRKEPMLVAVFRVGDQISILVEGQRSQIGKSNIQILALSSSNEEHIPIYRAFQ